MSRTSPPPGGRSRAGSQDVAESRGAFRARTSSSSPTVSCGSAREPAVAGHGLHLDARGGEELTYLGGVLNDVQGQAAKKHSEQHPVSSMGAGKWPSSYLVSQCVKGVTDAAATPIDVPEKL
jgi:hypothetical protein